MNELPTTDSTSLGLNPVSRTSQASTSRGGIGSQPSFSHAAPSRAVVRGVPTQWERQELANLFSVPMDDLDQLLPKLKVDFDPSGSFTVQHVQKMGETTVFQPLFSEPAPPWIHVLMKNDADVEKYGHLTNTITRYQRHLSSCADPVYACLAKDSAHTNMVVPSGQVTNARRLCQKMLEEAGQPYVYADDASMLKDLEYDVKIEQGQPARADGPFRQLLASGGTLILNLSRRDGVPRFTAQQLEAFNTLMEEQSWGGQTIPCRQDGQRVKIVFLCDTDTLSSNVLSGAQVSRTVLRNFEDYAFPEAGDPPVFPARQYPENTVKIVDLQEDASWSRTLFGGPELTETQEWQDNPGALNGFAFEGPLVLRNPPSDPRLMDFVRDWQQAGHQVRLESGLPDEEAASLVALKSKATDLADAMRDRPGTVCVLHPGNMTDVLDGTYGEKGGALAKIPSLLKQAQSQATGKLPIVYVSKDLSDRMWDRLMQHPARFAIAAVPGVKVPAPYAGHVARQEPGGMQRAPELNALRRADTWQQPVTFLHTADPTLIDGYLPPPSESVRIFITPTTRCDELIFSLQRENHTGAQDFAGTSGLPRLQLKMHQLIDELKAGKTVILHGLENNPELAQDLATLLHPPHYLPINGERITLGEQGSLQGRVIIVTPDHKLVDTHALTPAYTDPAPAGGWREAVRNRLSAALSLSTAQVEKRLTPLLDLFDVLSQVGVLPRKQPPVSYATLETLCRALSALTPSGQLSSHEQARLVRSLLKDMLIGDYRNPDLTHDIRYAQLKACLKVLFPAEMSNMPSGSVDTERLQSLLAKHVNHPHDIEALSWQFLNAFSPDVIKEIIGTPLMQAVSQATQPAIGAKVLALVCAQARLHDIPLPPLVAQVPEAPSPVQVQDVYMRPAKLSRDDKLAGKIAQAQLHAGAIFLKGPPGAGKTHLVESMTKGRPVFWANIADEGTQAFYDKLQAWATGTPPGTLVIDEANLASPENLAMFKGVFSDRTLYVNGRLHQLEASHQIVFTGNADVLPGRTVQQVARESFATVQFKSMQTDFLRTAFVEPLLDHALATTELGMMLDSSMRDAIGEQALQIFERLQKGFPAAGLSPRDLEEYLTQVLCHVKAQGRPINVDELAPVLARVALEVYAPLMTESNRPIIEAWLRHQLGVELATSLPSLWETQAIGAHLKQAGLAPTPASVDLAGKVDWWLHTQTARDSFNPKANTLGKKALLIEGPASRGKDTVVKAMLEAQGKREGIDFVHINANPNDLDSLRTTVIQARERGQIVLVSELNLLPSGILEGELNSLLTGQTGNPAAPGFGLIATINRGYAGRKPFSAALKNRMHTITLQDYATSELLPIAKAHANKLHLQKPSALQQSGVSNQKIQDLVELHKGLLNALQGQSREFRPGIRQLRDAIGLLDKRSTLTPRQAFESVYSAYVFLAEQPSSVASGESETGAKQVEQQLRCALALAYPDKRFPFWQADRTLPTAIPLTYDAKGHCIRFHPEAPLEQLAGMLLELARRGELFSGRTTYATLEPPSSQPISFKPKIGGSGVGRADRRGTVGKIDNPGKAATYLVTSQQTVGENEVMWEPRRVANTQAGSTSNSQRVTLKNRPADADNGQQRRVYLLAASNTRPATVRVDGRQVETVHRDEHGGWYIPVPNNVYTVTTVTYDLVPDDQIPIGQLDATQCLPDDFPDLKPAFNAPLAQKIAALEQRRSDLNHAGIVAELETIFKTTLQYSSDDADALERANTAGARCQRFLTIGQGVCYEFATSFAAVLTQTFGIAARTCSGYRTEPGTGDIPAQAHRWVEYCDENGQWHTVDPTAPARDGGNTSRNRSIAGSGHAGSTSSTTTRSSLATRAQSVSSAETAPPITSGPNLFNEEFEPDILEHLSLNALGLNDSDMQRGGENYHPTSGVFDLKRALAGEVDMFRRSTLKDVTKPRPVVIEDLPPSGDKAAWRKFWTIMIRPIAALQRKGVPVLVGDGKGNVRPAAFIDEIQARCGKTRHGENAPTDGTPIVLNKQSGAFLDRLASHYYESLLVEKSVNPGDENAVKLCILEDLSSAMGEEYPLPIELTLHGQKISITGEDLQKFWQDGQKAIDELNQYDTPPGQLAALVANDAHLAETIGDMLERLTQIARLRGNATRPEFTSLQDTLMVHIQTYLEHAPVLQNARLIHYFGRTLYNLPASRQEEKKLKFQLLVEMSHSVKPKTLDAEVAIAVVNARAFVPQLVSKKSQSEVIGHMRRIIPQASAVSRSIVLSSLIYAFNSKRRHYINSDLLPDYRALCDALVQTNDDFTPEDLDGFMGNLSFATSPSDDEKTKTWSLSLIDKLSKMAAAFPTAGRHISAVNLCYDIDLNKFVSIDHQIMVVEILKRLMDAAQSIARPSQNVIKKILRQNIDNGRIASELAPRFEAIIQRVSEIAVQPSEH